MKPIYNKIFFYLVFVTLFSNVFAVSPSLLEKSFPIVTQVSEFNTYDLSVSSDDMEVLDKYLVVLLDMYGNQTYSKIVIVDVDMQTSILVAKDIFHKINKGVYTVINSSADNLISQRLIIQ